MVAVDGFGIVLAGGAFVVAVAVVLLAQLVDAQVLVVAAQKAQHGVHDEAHHHADDDLRAHDLDDGRRRHLLGQEYGQHLVGGGEEHGEHGAQRHHAPGVERRRSRREPALGHRPQHRADDRARRAGMLDGLLGLSGGAMLQPLHRQIGDEQKRDQVERVLCRMLQHVREYMSEFFHSGVL